MSDKCPKCGKELICLGGCSAHHNHWYCSDEKGCGWNAWTTESTGVAYPQARKAMTKFVMVPVEPTREMYAPKGASLKQR